MESFDVSSLAAAIRAREVSPVEVVEDCLRRVADKNDTINALCTVDADGARKAAHAAEQALRLGDPVGPLHGVPIAVKDLIFTSDMRTTGGSLLYEDFVPDEDDIVVERLKQAGAIIVGKTNTAEFGFSGNHTANRLFGRTANPCDPRLTPGGSSGGSAAAVAAGMVPAALGSDGGGSIRIPSSFCGVFGIKPTFGAVPLYPGCRDARYPGLNGWESLEHLGPITRTAQDAALLLDVLVGLDTRDRYSMPWPGQPSFLTGYQRADPDLRDLRIAWSVDWAGTQPVDDDVVRAVKRTLDRLVAAGAQITEAVPDCDGVVEAFGAIMALDFDAEAIAALAAGRESLVGDRVRGMFGQTVDFGHIVRAFRRRKAIYASVERFFREFDVLLTPTAPVVAFSHDEIGPVSVGGQPQADRLRAIIGYCCPFNLTGHPAASLPGETNEAGLPVGIQVVAPRFREDLILRVAKAFEEVTGSAAVSRTG